MCCLQGTYFKSRDKHKVRGWEKVVHANGNQRKLAQPYLHQTKQTTRDKEGHYIMMKGSIQEDVTTVNICAPNIGAPQYIRQALTATKGELASNTIIVRDFSGQNT